MTAFKNTLIHERSRPDFRERFGELAAKSDWLCAAVKRIRLSGLDLSAAELQRVRLMRVLLAEVNALSLAAEADVVLADPARARNLTLIARLIREGRLLVRSAPLGGWTPDFSVFGVGNRPTHLLAGLHWFQRPYPHRGPVFGFIQGHEEATFAAERFEENWRLAHDISQPFLRILTKADRRSPLHLRAVAERTRTSHPPRMYDPPPPHPPLDRLTG